MKIFHLGMKKKRPLKCLCSAFSVWHGSQKLKISVRLVASINCIFPGFTREPDVGDFLSYRIMGKEIFAFPVFSLQLSNIQDLQPVNSVMNWPENIPRVKPIDNVLHSVLAFAICRIRISLYCFFFQLFRRKTVKEEGVIFTILKPAIQKHSKTIVKAV